MFFRIKSKNVLNGGWWYGEDVPYDYWNDITSLSESVPGMNKIVAERRTKSNKVPSWINNYFEDKS